MTYSPKAFEIAVLGTSQIGKFISTHGTTGDVIIPDDDKFSFGTGSDASIYFDATNLVIADENIPVQIGNTSSTVTILGNLTVSGDTVTQNVATVLVEDPLMLLAYGQTGSGAYDAGLIIERGDDANVGIIWDESGDEFSVINTSSTATEAGNVTIASYAAFQSAALTASTGTFSGILKTDDLTDATNKTNGSLQTDGGLSVAKAIYNGTAATFAADSGVVTIGSTTAATFSAAGLLNVNNATEATSTTDGSLQTDGGLSVAKSAVIGVDLDLLSDGAIINIGSTSKFTLTDQAANNCVMAASGARLAFGNAGEYITGDGTDLAIVSSGDVDITGDTDVVGGLSSTQATTLASAAGVTTIGSTTGATFSAAGLLNVNNATDAATKTDGSLQTDGGLSVAKKAYIGTGLTVEAGGAHLTAGRLTIDDATEATSATDGSLQTDGGLSVAKDIVGGDDLILLTDSAVIHFGEHKEVTLTHVHDSGLTLKHTATADDKPVTLTLATGEIDMAADDVIGVINFQAPDEGTGTDAILVAAGIAAVSEGDFAAGSNATKLSFRTAASEAASEKMSLSSGGNLTVSGDVTVNGGDITVAGATPKITIGDAEAEDAMLAFDGIAQDFHIALDDTADDLVIGVGTTAGTTTAIAINEAAQVSVVDLFAANVAGTFGTFTDGDATPSVATGNLWKHHASTQTINMFDDGVAGQTIHVISTAAITYDFDASNLKCGSADIVTASGDITSWFFDGTNWYLVQFMDVSSDMSSVGGGGVADSVAADNITLGDGAVAIATSIGDITLTTQANDTDIILQVNDDGSVITALTLDGSEDGAATFKSTVTATTSVKATTVFVVGVQNATGTGAISKGFTDVDASGDNYTMTLPTGAAGSIGNMYTVKKMDSSTNTVTVTTESSDKIDGGDSIILYHQYESITVVYAATNKYYVM
jgi:hypothetical protein